jgi:iron complex outermembrane receptor protein
MGRRSISRGAGGGDRLDFGVSCRALLVASLTSAAAVPALAEPQNLDTLSISELANTDVSSVIKTAQPLSSAPGAIYVITREEILRSGAKRLPEMLRLAPNLFVAQTSANTYVITARGFSGNAAAESFSDKLLVLIDGRTVYDPIFEGVNWEAQGILPENIDRIEVISGPGATLWGANAVNGVINVITRKSYDTQGGFAAVDGGNLEHGASLRYGGRISDDLTYRLYAMDFGGNDTVTSTGARARDHWSTPQGGFRFDWTPTGGDAVTVQGDAYDGSQAQLSELSGANLIGRWDHSWASGATLQVQAYFDRTFQGTDQTGGLPYWVDTYDLDVQHSFSANSRNDIVLGGGVRTSDYHIGQAVNFNFTPSRRKLDLSNIFIEDSYSVSNTVKLIGGFKLEDDPFSGVTPLPSLRLSWTPVASLTGWAAVSRAIRAPTPFDADPVEKLGSLVYLVGDPHFLPETLTAYEAGLRSQPIARASFSASIYFNLYDDLRSVELSNGGLPITWGNRMKGETHGFEAWGNYQAAAWWRLSASLNLLSEHLEFKDGASRLLGLAQAGDDPHAQAMLKSSMAGRRFSFDADLRYVDALPSPSVPAYVELNSRIGWDVTPRLQVALAGFNLLHDRHQEFPAPWAEAVPRSVLAELRGRF